jgi:hypothetical protein
MKLSRRFPITATALACAAVAAPAGFAGGEPKNNSPFTRPASGPATVHLASALPSTTRSSLSTAMGEAKNLPPFNVRLTTSILVSEPKNVLPFTRLVRLAH